MKKRNFDSGIDKTYITLGNVEYEDKKSYYPIWRRALSKIKINLLIQRYAKFEKNHTHWMDFSLFQQESQHMKIEQAVDRVILPNNMYYISWLFIVLVSITFITFFATFYTSFYGDESSSGALVVEKFADIVFLIDLFMNFNIAYYDDMNILVKERRKIAIKYCKFQFWIDFLVILPFLGSFSNNSGLFMFRHLIKVLKWITFKEKVLNFQYIKSLDYFFIIHNNFVSSFTILIISCGFFHVFACIFYLSARYNEFSKDCWVVRINIQNDSIFSKYLTTIYWSLTTVASIGYGDIHPYTPIEIAVSMIWMCIGVLTISYSVSKITIILKKIKNNELLMDENLQKAEDFSKKTKISKVLHYKLKQAVRKQKIFTYRFQIFKIVESLESHLRYEVASDIYGKALKNIQFFSDKTEEFIGIFAFKMEFMQFYQEKYIWRKNAYSDGIYFIISGSVKYFYNEMMFYVYSDGGFFGDSEIFFKTERKFDVMSGSLFKCFKISRESLKFLKTEYLNYYNELKSMTIVRSDNLINGLAQMTAIYKFRDCENLKVNRDIVEKLKTEFTLSLFDKDFFAFGNEKFEEFLNDLKYFKWILKRVQKKIRDLIGEYQYINLKD